MNELLCGVIVLALAFGAPKDDSALARNVPQSQPADTADVHSGQSLGRVIVTSTGETILFEWGRPYLNWVPDFEWMAPAASKRLETTLYKVDTTKEEPTSNYLFHPSPGATYWLGDISPDEQKVAVFELDHDNKSVRAGVYDLMLKKQIWFELRPDEGALGSVTPWINSREFLYPIKESATSRTRFARANATSGDAQPCYDCTPERVRRAERAVLESQARARALSEEIYAPDLPKGALLLAGSANGQVGVYALDTRDVLTLMFVQPGYSTWTIFENPRHRSRSKN